MEETAASVLDSLEKNELLRQALPPLAKKRGVPKVRAWEILERYQQTISGKIARWGEPAIRQEVNLFWGRHRKDFPALGLSCLLKCKGPSALPAATYHQLICLAHLDDIFYQEGLSITKEKRRQEEAARQARAQAQAEAVIERKPSLWERFVRFLKRCCQH